MVADTPAHTAAEIASLKSGFSAFVNTHCGLCHSGPNLTTAAIVTNASLLTPTANASFGPSSTPIPYGATAIGSGAFTPSEIGVTQYGNSINRDFNFLGNPVIMDLGFFNTGVADPNADPGLAGLDAFGNPLSFSVQYINYLAGKSSGILDPGINTNRACDFSTPLAYNAPPATNLYQGVPGYFMPSDGLIADGSREGVLRNQNCLDAKTAYIPSIAAAKANLSNGNLDVATQAAFKIPSLRNIALTGPYMHNGSMATLHQVLQFYARQGNFQSDNTSFNLIEIQNNLTDPNIEPNLIAFLNSLTDPRVAYQQAPFDHPQIIIPNGQVGNDHQVTAGNPLGATLGQDQYLTLPAVGASGASTPITPFLLTSP